MELPNIDIAIAILDYLKDAEYHSIRATTLHVGKHLHLSDSEMNQPYESRKSNVIDYPLAKTQIYTQTVLEVSFLRKAKLLKDFVPGKSKGFFAITDEGLTLLKKNKSEIKNKINSELSKQRKTKKSTKN